MAGVPEIRVQKYFHLARPWVVLITQTFLGGRGVVRLLVNQIKPAVPACRDGAIPPVGLSENLKGVFVVAAVAFVVIKALGCGTQTNILHLNASERNNAEYLVKG
ncbi:hypothetical protein SPM24T3_18516 [Serratia sp. M24T3]|nr:hypothetical protein SPM24T3_18516 [Serratia sp. M24T3]